MTETEFLGYLVVAVCTLGSFVAVIMKLTQPINDLKVVIQELRDCISSLKENNSTQNHRLDDHDKEIESLKGRMGKVETKVDMYHGKM